MSSKIVRWIAPIFQRWQRLVVLLLACFVLSGCVDSEVGVKFDSPYHGVISQRLKFDDRFSSLSGGSAQAWFSAIEQRARQVQGKVRRFPNKEVLVTIPFSTGQDLEKKFNRFFNTEIKPKTRSGSALELPKIDSTLKVHQGNFLLLENRRIVYDVDLRSLGLADAEGTAIVNPSSVLNLEFALTGPWGAKSLMTRTKDGVSIPSHREGKQLVWELQLGQKNHLEATLWMPNSLGIGTVFLIAIVVGGIYLKNQQSSTISPSSSASR
jgi:hypothetical protein